MGHRAVEDFMQMARPDMVMVAAVRVGGILPIRGRRHS
jgi:hypothetical protein